MGGWKRLQKTSLSLQKTLYSAEQNGNIRCDICTVKRKGPKHLETAAVFCIASQFASLAIVD